MRFRKRVVGAGAIAALALVGGTVTGTEIDDEESYYEIEILRSGGSRVDVQLDRSFHFVSEKADGEGQHEAG